MQYISIILLSIILLINIIYIIIKLNKQKKYKEEYLEKKKEELAAALTEENHQLALVEQRRSDFEANLASRIELSNRTFADQENALKKQISILQEKYNVQKDSLLNVLKEHYSHEYEEYERTLRETENLLREDIEQEMTILCNKYENEIADLLKEINDYRAKQAAINEEILRQRAIDEQQDFYRICITEADLEDIDILLTLKARLHRSDFLDKITYDTYVSKYVKEMAKRVLSGKDPSGIYKVTNIKTNEIYIGKSTTVASRWQNHVKSAFGLEGVADSQFQRALKKYGVQNFTWELLEEITKDKLTEREKYYISFYDTTKYGYNQRVG